MMTLHPEILIKDGKKQFAVLPYEEFVSLKERLEDMEDLLQLRKAKKAEGRKRSVSLSRVKRELGLK
ncbi:Type II toxin-antitoxin system Phd/YefM family antitoxin [Nitrospira tepida]|uniref:Type II toxin-antitoxin system Phd/YefM family antitoxin n=1 Tax=Nitrospira tepida TaxID=2973512 RepID=A0AA86MYL1_9BACT|nr:type II toxin-antitoxin system Phd/YefM family antitoxin [Nitrospira tepida]CAI4031443.1 Type II toxin-antitoxin system Phd/YefM family antitoxin [Nitrospira tepida]